MCSLGVKQSSLVLNTPWGDLMQSLRRDASYAIRTLSASPLFTSMVVLSLSLAVGGVTVVFSFIDAVLLRPFPYRDPERMVLLWASKTKQITRGLSGPDLIDLRSQNKVFEDVVPYVGYSGEPLEFGNEGLQKVYGFYVGAGFFSLMGVRPYLGRTFRPDEDHPGAEKVAVLSYLFWMNRMAGNPAAVGSAVSVSGERYIIVGVMPPNFFFPDETVEVWLPILPSQILPDRGAPMVHAVARVRAGVTLVQAQAEVDTIVRRMASTYPETDKNLTIGLFPAVNEIVGDYRAALWSLFGGSALLLLIACANIAHMLLARGLQRSSEIAVRVALGASRAAIFRQLLTESVLLGMGGGILGALLAFWGVRLILALGFSDIPRFGQATMDGKVLLFCLAVSFLTGILFGLPPALHTSRPNLIESLKQGGVSYSSGVGSNLRDLLLVSEISFAFVLMIGAGLLIRSFVRLARLDWGFRTDHILVVDVDWPDLFHNDGAREAALARQVLPSLRALPRVESVSFGHSSLISHYSGAPGSMTLNGKTMDVWQAVAGPGYFQTLGIRILRGREFMESDNEQAPKSIIVDKNLASQLWPGENPVGKILVLPEMRLAAWNKEMALVASPVHGAIRKLFQDPASWDQIPRQVIGVVEATRTFGLLPLQYSTIYYPYPQAPRGMAIFSESFFLRTLGDPSTLTKTAQEVVRTVATGVTVDDAETLQERATAAIGGKGSNKLLMLVGTGTSALGLLLATLGIYGVLGYSTALRTREIGIRMALGAQQSSIFLLILGRALLLTVVGVLFGLAGAITSTKILGSYLFGVTPTDPATFAASGFLFLGVAFIASFWPARRAMLTEPLSALRHE